VGPANRMIGKKRRNCVQPYRPKRGGTCREAFTVHVRTKGKRKKAGSFPAEYGDEERKAKKKKRFDLLGRGGGGKRRIPGTKLGKKEKAEEKREKKRGNPFHHDGIKRKRMEKKSRRGSAV